MNPIFGLPVIRNPYVPKGKIYVLNGNMIVFGTWEPRRYRSVASIIAMQRRRR